VAVGFGLRGRGEESGPGWMLSSHGIERDANRHLGAKTVVAKLALPEGSSKLDHYMLLLSITVIQ
ncbi:MAG: hypothetical protein JSV10_05935, partial [Candidatus Zixiibacteriota bacterium]